MTLRIILNVSFFLVLLQFNLLCCHYFIMTPLDHPYCLNRPKNSVMNKLSVGHRMLTMRIEPNSSALLSSKTNAICSGSLIQPLGNRVRHVAGGDCTWSYWFLSVKISGKFSSCADFLTIGEITEDYSYSDLKRSESTGIRINCREKLPTVIQTRQRQMLIWWHWSRETQPRMQLDISSYIQYRGSWSTPDKIKVCNESMGFWCAYTGGSDGTCIHGAMRCDGDNNCDSFSLKDSPSFVSADEYNCYALNNQSNIHITPKLPYYESVWIARSLYILLGFTILILLVSACKICLHNSTLVSRLRKSHSLASIQSSSSSSNYDKPDDNEEVYEELPTYGDLYYKDSQSQNISIDDVTHEEFLAASTECLEPNCSCEIFQPRLIGSNREPHNLVVDTEIPVTNYCQSQPQSSSKYQSHAQIQAPLSTKTITKTVQTDSLTGNILAHGQDVIARLNLPGPSRNFHNKLWKKLRTSSYDKINDAMSSISSGSPSGSVTGNGCDNKKSKSNTISRLEMNSRNGADSDQYFESYVII